MAISDDALQAAIMLTDKFVTGRAQPDKSIDVLDEACAHAQATAHLPVELEQIVKERRKVDAAIRRRLARGEKIDDTRADSTSESDDPIEAFAREIGPALERIGAEIEKLFGTTQSDRPPARPPDRPTAGPSDRPESLSQRRDRLDGELRKGLEQLGVVVRGADVARAVGAAVGKRIEWTG